VTHGGRDRSQPHRWLDLEVDDVGRAEPSGSVGLLVVGTELIGNADWGGNGVEAQDELLMHGVVGVDRTWEGSL
jgi:hypothetical protein